VGGLRAAIEIARMYAPCVVFAEDIDRAVAGDTRTVSIDDVLNIVDGVESKKDELLLVLTTNHVERINKAMLRPGRIDAVIEISPPDAAAVAKLMRLYCGELLSPGDKLEQSSARLAGQIPAVIAEVCRKAKLYAITRDPNNLVITDEDLDVAGEGMAAHFKLMQDAVEDTSSPATRLAGAFKAIVGDVVGDVLVGAEVIDQKPVLNS
jgi:transitional endoplasmic reticulum ATPase